jgi:FMN-dependent NADH-azoreductase
MILFINACVRTDSRTKRLADSLLAKWVEPVEEVRVGEVHFSMVDEAFLRRRDWLIAAGDFDNPLFDLARQFAAADRVVVAAPYWDLSFPAALKQYFEQINVLGVTFYYTPEGEPKGLCRAKRMTYITTAGGDHFPAEFGAGYAEALAKTFYGIPEFRLIKAVGLDLEGADPRAKIEAAKEEIRKLYSP